MEFQLFNRPYSKVAWKLIWICYSTASSPENKFDLAKLQQARLKINLTLLNYSKLAWK